MLGVTDYEGVMEAVKLCWASQYSVRSVLYRYSQVFLVVEGRWEHVLCVWKCFCHSFFFNFGFQGLPLISTMGVVVQEMIDSRVSGVCFSANPVSGDREEVIPNNQPFFLQYIYIYIYIYIHSSYHPPRFVSLLIMDFVAQLSMEV